MRIFGMPLWPEKISDEQYVERTRKGLRTLRRWRFVYALGSLAIIGGMIFLIILGVHLLGNLAGFGDTSKHHPVDPSRQQLVYAMYYLAVVIGTFIGFMFGHAISNVALVLLAWRKDKLLVEFWDALSDAEKTRLRQMSS